MQVYITQLPVYTITLLNLLFFARVQCEVFVEQGSQDATCTGDTCVDEEILKHEKAKYYIEKAKEYHAAHTDKENPSDEMTDEELKQILSGFRDKTIDIENINSNLKNINNDIENRNSDIAEKETESHNVVDNLDGVQNSFTFEFPKLKAIDPGDVGDVVELEIEDGHVHNMITRSIRPVAFEIPNFLSDAECDYIIETAKENGLNVSNLFGSDVEEEFKDLDLSDISRVSEQTWLRVENLGNEFWGKLQQRLAKLTDLPLEIIQRGEPIQVVSYVPGGHYHAHLDTIDGADHLPCCFQTQCGDKSFTPAWKECCRVCRFATVLYYLNEPEEGGETAFPLADMPDELFEEKFVNIKGQEWYNLSRYCHNATLKVTPKRGTAILWYNHFVDEQTGYLGKVDRRSHHGGCDLIRGSKWIANNWIAGSTYEDRFKPSMFYNDDS